MIRIGRTGRYFCDGHECGYPLSWQPLPEDEYGAPGVWLCLDCGDAVYDALFPRTVLTHAVAVFQGAPR